MSPNRAKELRSCSSDTCGSRPGTGGSASTAEAPLKAGGKGRGHGNCKAWESATRSLQPPHIQPRYRSLHQGSLDLQPAAITTPTPTSTHPPPPPPPPTATSPPRPHLAAEPPNEEGGVGGVQVRGVGRLAARAAVAPRQAAHQPATAAANPRVLLGGGKADADGAVGKKVPAHLHSAGGAAVVDGLRAGGTRAQSKLCGHPDTRGWARMGAQGAAGGTHAPRALLGHAGAARVLLGGRRARAHLRERPVTLVRRGEAHKAVALGAAGGGGGDDLGTAREQGAGGGQDKRGQGGGV